MSTGGSGNGAAEVQARLTSPCDPALCGATVHPHQDQPALPRNVQPPVCPRKVGSPALSYTYTYTHKRTPGEAEIEADPDLYRLVLLRLA
jgi:hypothetical protein